MNYPPFLRLKLEKKPKDCQGCGGIGWVWLQTFLGGTKTKIESSTCLVCNGKG